jgi:hypothetical protein
VRLVLDSSFIEWIRAGVRLAGALGIGFTSRIALLLPLPGEDEFSYSGICIYKM